MSSLTTCPDCKVQLSSFDGPVHEYLGGNAACWKLFGEILTREYSDLRYMKFHRWTVDSYAAQHPGKPEPRSIQSVHIHLLALYLQIEKQSDPTFISKVMQKVTQSKKGQLEWLPPPAELGKITVLDIKSAASPEEHGKKVTEWGHSVWEAWKAHHTKIKSLI